MKMVKRIFYPGDEWIFFKLYLGQSNANAIILSLSKAINSALMKKNIVDKWFFIRYSDPEFHLRVRLHLNSCDDFGKAVACMNKYLRPFLREKVVRRVVIDSYQREVERYGGQLIVDCENIFCKDSNLVSSVIASSENTEVDYIAMGISVIDSYLKAIGLDLNARILFVDKRAHAYMKEMVIDKSVNINKLIRQHKDSIYAKVNDKILFNSLFQTDDFKKIEAHEKKSDIAASLIHMSINRLFPSNQRTYEMICYIALQKYYDKLKHISAASDSPK